MSDYLKKLFIDEAKAVLIKGSISSGGGDVSDDEIATDDEVGDVIDDIFNTEEEDSGNTDTGTENPEDGNIATDDEVGDVIDDVFG